MNEHRDMTSFLVSHLNQASIGVHAYMLKCFIIEPRCVCGAPNTGKSAITVRFLSRRFIGEYQRNIQLSYGGVVQFGPNVIKYELKDTSSHKHNNMDFLSTWPNCLAVVYSVTDRTSFETAAKILHHVDDASKTLHIALMANKCDLGHFRRVSWDQG